MKQSSQYYKKGDFIGRNYEIFGILGKGGFGVVYLVYSHETKSVHALKTFRDEFLQDAEIRNRFRKEASIWVDLERHPYLVRAYHIEEVSDRLYIAMEYIAPNEQGLNSLEDYLQRQPPDIAQSLVWAIQCCHGMEYAYSKGIHSHRDIKPANIMISQDRTVKITDFGLAGVLDTMKAIPGNTLSLQQGKIGLTGQTIEGIGFGTPTHMPPEQFINASRCDERSDIYAFGIVLYQMAAGGKLPFIAPLPRNESEEEMRRFLNSMQRLHSESPIPKLNSIIFPIIQRCLEKNPEKRYEKFTELRKALEPLLRRETGEVVKPPELKELEMWEWNDKGNSLDHLGRFDEAIRCYEKAIEIDPRFAKAWNNKGKNLNNLGRFEEAIRCYDKAIELDSRLSPAWYNKGLSLHNLKRFEDAIRCYDKAIELDPRYANAWNNKGNILKVQSRFDEAMRCYDKALEIDPRIVETWYNKGVTLSSLSHFDLAIRSYEKALEIDPRNLGAWHNKALTEEYLGRSRDAIYSCKQFIELAPAQHAVEVERFRHKLQELERK